VDALLQPPDILPTVIDLAGVQPAPPQPFHGRSFAPLLRGEKGGPEREFVVTASFVRLRNGELGPKLSTPVLTTKEWAYAPIGAEGDPELFDLRTDPYGETNVIAAHRDTARDLHACLLDWLREMEAPEEAVAPFRV